jgi:hypothetical protein
VNHLNIGIFRVDANGTPQRNSNRTVAGEECPPDSFPQSLVRPTELRAFNTRRPLACEPSTYQQIFHTFGAFPTLGRPQSRL